MESSLQPSLVRAELNRFVYIHSTFGAFTLVGHCGLVSDYIIAIYRTTIAFPIAYFSQPRT
jgi:hypothetical protein